MDTSHYITLHFESGFNGFDKGPFLLEVERLARRMLSAPAEVFLERHADDSKLRMQMTPAEREKL